jgi:hypothetical protein
MNTLGLLVLVVALSIGCALFAGEFLDEAAARRVGPPKGRS